MSCMQPSEPHDREGYSLFHVLPYCMIPPSAPDQAEGRRWDTDVRIRTHWSTGLDGLWMGGVEAKMLHMAFIACAKN
jgi:hypothetical protein